MCIPIICIYKITNISNKKIYIGSTSNYIHRKYKHLFGLRNNRHENKRLQNAWNKYGEHAFSFDIVENICDVKQLISIEQKYIDKLNPFYNICKTASTRLGVKASIETLEKMKIAKLNQSAETRMKISATLKSKNIKKTEAEKHNISLKLKSRKFTDDHKLKIKQGLLNYCKNRSDSHKYNLLNAHIGNKHSAGIKLTQEQKENLKKAKQDYWAKKRALGTHGIKISQYHINGEFIRIWNAAKDVQLELGISASSITKVCRNKQQTAKGYKWKYLTSNK